MGTKSYMTVTALNSLQSCELSFDNLPTAEQWLLAHLEESEAESDTVNVIALVVQ
mgnify:CR=1 FL=1